MNAKINAKTALDFLTAYEKGGLDAVRPFFAKSFIWWTPRMGEIQDKLEEVERKRVSNLKSGLKFEVLSSIAEENRVALELRYSCLLLNGREYNQYNMFLYIFEEGKISVLREFNDSKHAHDVWGEIY